jgi:ABC-type nitrate/sulfonate/bicarbonate transport system substrate-binding protein
VAYPIDRRTFLRRGVRTAGGAAVLGVAGPALLEACSSSSKSSSSSSSAAGTGTTGAGGSASTVAPGSLGALTVQLPWVPDVESGGEFVAVSKGLYTAQGFSSVNLTPGGPNATPQETVVQQGKALIGCTSLDSTAAAIQKGFNLKCIGAEYQKNPFCIMSQAAKPINTPRDMYGKKIGVQSPNDSVWAAFLKANNLDASKITKVVVQFDPTPLAQGQVDGWFSFITNEPIELGLQGVKTHTFLLADYNYPEVGNIWIATTDSLQNARAKVVAAMTAEIMAWRECIQNPDEPAQATMAKYAQGLTLKAEQLQSLAQNQLMLGPDVDAHGLMYIGTDAQAANVKTLGFGGTTVTTSQLFDMSVLDDVYQAHPELKSVPTPGTIPGVTP